ncbi:MAG: NUDIX domain-containing protein [Clostridiales bacterium]|jgi:8-oxo-dGTP diphosphatase|nr:NUDIX domain-containing protein [Clostridiales bacterium]
MRRKTEVTMELWDLLDGDGKPTGRLLERGKPVPRGYYYKFVHVLVYSEKYGLLVQKRAMSKKSHPGEWTVTGGAVIAGEDSRTAAHRELLEEIGLDIPPERFRLVAKLRRRYAFLDLWAVRTDAAPEDCTLQAEEVDAIRFVGPREFLKVAAPDNGRRYPLYYRALISYLKSEKLLRANG